MKLVGKRWLVAVLVCVGAVIWSGVAVGAQDTTPRARVVSAPQNDKMVMLHGNVHPMARPANDRGTLADQQPVTRMHLLLQRSAEQEAALQQLMADQLDPKSPRFHQWLTPQQFGEQFGTADSDIQAVKDWLSAQGFTGMKVNNGKTMVEFNGTAGQIRNALRTEMHHLSVNGEEHFANWSEPQIPAALAPVISGVAGLHNFHPKPLLRRLGKFQRNAKTGEVTPLFTFSDVNGTFFGVGPADFSKIYNVPTTFSGTGVSIAIVGQSNINLQDVRDFRTIFGLPANDPQVILNGPDPGLVSGDEGESDLDVEWAGAVAPNATIKFVASEITSTNGLSGVDASAVYIVDNNVAPILSESYGLCESSLGVSVNQFYNALWQQAAAEGITVILSAGDNGSAGCDDTTQTTETHGIAVSGLASTPFNVAMGGTDFNQKGIQTNYWNNANGTGEVSAKGYIPEMVWNDSCAATGATGCNNVTSSSSSLNIVAGSGGPSSIYPKPAFQSLTITGMPNDGHRDLPDISLFSSDGPDNKSFYIVCQSDQDITGDTGCNLTTFSANKPFHDFQAVGGTSAAAPTFAGIMALIVQKTGQRQGNANVTLYNLGKAETFSSCDSSSNTALAGCVFHDITSNKSFDNLVPNQNNSVACAGASTGCSKTTSGAFGVLVAGGNPAFNTTAGYDLATGLGSVNVTNLVNSWSTSTGTGSAAASVVIDQPSVSGTAGSAGNITGTVTGGNGTATGVVIFENAATNAPLGAASTSLLSGSYTISGSLLPQGTYTLKAHYSGDTTYAAKDSAAINVNLSKQNSTTTVSFVTFNSDGSVKAISTAAQSVTYGSAYVLRIDVAGTTSGQCTEANGNINAICPSGTVSLFDNGSALMDFPNAQTPNASNTARLNNSGFAEDQPIQLSVGSHPIKATYTADAASSYNSNSTSNTLSVTITQATTATAVVSNTSSVTSGQSVTLTATVSSGSNSSQGPSGTVQFLVGGTSLGSAATCAPVGATTNNAGTFVGASCTATLTTALSSLPPGFYIPRPKPMPFAILNWLAAFLASISLLLATRTANRKRQFAYAATVLALLSAAAIAGCGGGSGGGGGGGGSARAISGKYSGDANYATSTSTAVTVTVH